MNYNSHTIIKELQEKQIIEYGNFILKSGEKSNIYVDLRKIISYPHLIMNICYEINNYLTNINYDSIVGVPLGGYSLAQTCSILNNKPCLLLRKEVKNHGKKQLIEGIWNKQDKIVLIDDVITSGTSLLETIDVLHSIGLNVVSIVVILKRNDNGIKKIWEQKKIKVYSLFCLKDLQTKNYKDKFFLECYQNKPFLECYKNKFVCRLLNIIKTKKTNIILSIDLDNIHEIINLLYKTCKYICGVKLHLDIIHKIDEKFINELVCLSKNENFIIIEDRKFADIGNTIKHQLENHPYNIIRWIDAVTVHSLPGKDILNVFKQYNIPVLLIQEMSSKNNLFHSKYTYDTLQIAHEYKDIILGMIGQKKYDSNFLLFTPGIHMDTTNDDLGQQYKTPKKAIVNGTDVFIIGRSIYNSLNPIKEIKKYLNQTYIE